MKKLLTLLIVTVLATGCGQHEEPRTDMPVQDTTRVKTSL